MPRTQAGNAKVAAQTAENAQTTRNELVTQARGRGQPTIRNEEVEMEILTRLSAGSSLLQITNDPTMPARTTVNRWMMEDTQFLAKVMNAYQFNALYMAEAIMDVVDGGAMSTGNIERDKLKVSAIKWLAAKYNRTVFGEHVKVDQTTETIHIHLGKEFGDSMEM